VSGLELIKARGESLALGIRYSRVDLDIAVKKEESGKNATIRFPE
jgi:hypothetical protein